jgi:flagellar basal body P-ring protein FlgI
MSSYRVNRRAALLGCAVNTLLVRSALAGDKPKIPRLDKETPPKPDETVGDVGFIRSGETIKVEGVGLVIGLNNTGSNPEPSIWRTQLLDQMRKAQVPDAESWLESPTTSLVIVRAFLPVGLTTKDRIDVEMGLTPASTTTSLEGGHLLTSELKVSEIIEGNSHEGQTMAEAGGSVLLGSLAQPGDTRTGRILGGCRPKRDLPYQLVLKPERQGFRTASLLQTVINKRFYARKATEQVGLAEAKKPELIVLKVPQVYHQNQQRYFQVIQRMPLVDTADLRAARQVKWAKELLDPPTAGNAALCLEGIGRNTTPILQEGLKSSNAQVRFFAAEALAYLNDPAGSEVLAQTAVELPEFRAHALAALAAMDHSASILRLRELMAQADPKIRYGAFNALRSFDGYEQQLGRVPLMRNRPSEADHSDAAALRIRSAASSRPKVADPFELYLVDCEGPPLVHVARTRRCEVVVFGKHQRLETPLVLGGAGPILLNAADQDRVVHISRINDAEVGAAESHVESSPELGEVIRNVANLGASYAEVLEILRAADRQKNLQGPLVVDAVPGVSTDYDRAQLAGTDATATKTDSAVKPAGAETPAADQGGESSKRPGLFRRLRDRLKD